MFPRKEESLMIERIIRNLIAAITGIYNKDIVLYDYVLNRVEQLFYDKLNHDERVEVINLFAGSYEDSRKKIYAILDKEAADMDAIIRSPKSAQSLPYTSITDKEDLWFKRLKLSAFDEDNLRSKCFECKQKLMPIIKYHKGICDRANAIRKELEKLEEKDNVSRPFDIDEHDPFTPGNAPLNTSSSNSTMGYLVLIDNIEQIEIGRKPDNELGSIYFMLLEAYEKKSTYLPALVSREITAAETERKYSLISPHMYKFSSHEREMSVLDFLEKYQIRDISFNRRFKIETVKDIISYEAAEFSSTMRNEDIERLQNALISLSNNVWKGWSTYWSKYYTWPDRSKR